MKRTPTINEEIEKLRHSATAALSERTDVIIVASVSCIYGLGKSGGLSKTRFCLCGLAWKKTEQDLLRKLVDIQYTRNDMGFTRGTFRVRGDIVDIYPAGAGKRCRGSSCSGTKWRASSEINTGNRRNHRPREITWQCTRRPIMCTTKENIELGGSDHYRRTAMNGFRWFNRSGKLLEAQRIEQRTRYDMEMLREIGSCKGN